MRAADVGAIFKLEGGGMPVDLDTHIVQLPWFRLVRADAGLLLECAALDADRAVALLARAGARATLAQHVVTVASDLVPAIMSDLGPVALPGTVDSVTVRSLDLGEATARLMRRSHAILRPRRDDGGVRAILRAEERVIAWRRVLWARPSVLRSRRVRGARPVVFGREALERASERYALTRAGEVGRWARG
jgi:hypothetical protein